ncbi:hypothetical protein [Paracoccus sp. R86501]|uniref:hypothetical protein n=1 Tax=Paracoccus sp. R86501 TaxID=3101711 RepID=UPI00366EF2AE
MIRMLAFPLIAVATVGACTPKDFESAPVMVDTPSGQVTCQLYTQSMTGWDRATDAPDGMSIPVADGYCKKEGLARK